MTEASAPDSPTLVVANGLGGPRLSVRTLMEYFQDRYRFLTWDYRGLYESDRPAGGEEAYSMARHVDDLSAVLAAEGVERAGFLGWSMGVQVCLEAHRTLSDRMQAMVLLSGTFGRPLDGSLTGPAKPLLSGLLGAAQRHADKLERALRTAAGAPEFVPLLKRAGLMADTVDDHEFAEVVAMFSTLSVDSFLHNLKALGEHDASDELGRIALPVLIVTGDKDRMTPPELAKQMARRLQRADLLVVRGGTHYAAVEFPELIALRMERFFRAHAPALAR